MKNDRRNFLKLAGLAGAGMIVNSAESKDLNRCKRTQDQKFNMH